jgi:hypothetical protein
VARIHALQRALAKLTNSPRSDQVTLDLLIPVYPVYPVSQGYLLAKMIVHIYSGVTALDEMAIIKRS